MTLSKTIYLLFSVCFISVGFAQEDNSVQSSDALNGTLEEQFNYVFRRSNNFENHKVISKSNFEHLKKSSLDSVKTYRNQVVSQEVKLNYQNQELDSLKNEFSELNNEYLTVKKTKDEVSFFGLSFNNSIFNIIILGIIAFLILLLVLFVMKLKSAKAESKIAIENLSKVEDEYMDYKRKAIEKEQQLGRKLQDEINKNRKS